MVPNALACSELHGVFRGAGTRCSDETCGPGGVCCVGGAGGAVLVHKERECLLRPGGLYLGDGSSLDMRGVCDQTSGACLCGKEPTIDDCIETPNASLCMRIGGTKFLGSWSRCDDVPCPAITSKDAGACCVPPQFDQDVLLCRVVESKARCASLSGTWIGRGAECADDTCAVAPKGRCCVPTTTECREATTSVECRALHGHWGGADSQCGDEFACDPSKRGACCRDGYPCALLTEKACHHVGGRFQSVGSTCQDLDGGVCAACAPCHVDAPHCSDKQPCRSKHAFCSREFGRCMVLGTPKHENSTLGPWLCAGGDDDDDDDDTLKGLPCVAPPLFGKGRMGVCMRDGVDDGDWTCRRMKEFKRGCKCGTSGKTPAPIVVVAAVHSIECGAIHGLVQQLDEHEHKPVFGQTIELYRRATDDVVVDNKNNKKRKQKTVEFDFIAHQASGVGGHYAFAALRPGVYDVRVLLVNCWHMAAHEKSDRIVTVECREDSQRSKFLLDATVVEHHGRHETHLSDNINFTLVHRCAEAAAADVASESSHKQHHARQRQQQQHEDDDTEESERVVVIDDSIQWVREDKVPDKRALEDASDEHHHKHTGGGGGGGDGDDHIGTGWKVFFFMVILLCACLYCYLLYRMTVDANS